MFFLPRGCPVGLFDGLKKLFSGGGGKQKGKRKLKRVELAKRFDIRGRTGQGSMSKVFQAYDKSIHRVVCLKLLDKEKTQRFEDRFRLQGLDKPSEGEVCMQLKHSYIVQTYDYGITEKGEPFLSMEWIDGLGLNYLIETKAKQLEGRRLEYLTQLCDAIEYMHRVKFLHRDLCPRNVMVDKEGVVKLIDFGLTIPYTPEFCRPGNRTGTLDYLAPEIIRRQSTDHRIDLFALGVTAFELFTGTLPWEPSVSSDETLRRRMNSPPRNVADFRRDLEPDLVEILMTAISQEPKERFSSAAAFKEALLSVVKQDY